MLAIEADRFPGTSGYAILAKGSWNSNGSVESLDRMVADSRPEKTLKEQDGLGDIEWIELAVSGGCGGYIGEPFFSSTFGLI